MEQKYKYFNRDLSWLSFNYRVLQEAEDSSLPIYERLKFLAIFSNNLDEFYKIRVASYRSLFEEKDEKNLNGTDNQTIDSSKSREIVKKINRVVCIQLKKFGEIYDSQIIPEFSKNHIHFYQDHYIHEEHIPFVKEYFAEKVFSHISPSFISSDLKKIFLEDNVVYLVVKVRKIKSTDTEKSKNWKYVLIKIPRDVLPRFITLPRMTMETYIIFLDDIIRINLRSIFPLYEIEGAYSFKLSRDADLLIDDEFSGNLLEKIKESLEKRKTGAPSRFLYDKRMPLEMLRFLIKAFNLSKDDLVKGGRYHHLSDFFTFPKDGISELKPLVHLPHPGLDNAYSIFRAIKGNDWILHFPYHSYDYVIRFLNYAAINPRVEKIMATQYRVATNSAIVSALISAARNGKEVTVFVEVKARFDEATNLNFMDKMKAAGVKVISSLPGIKVHAKVALVVKKPSKDGHRRAYAFLSTGNFNEKTAKQYADHGLFTSNPEIISDIEQVFKYFENQEFKPVFKHLLVGQFNMNKKLKSLIKNEIENVKAGKEGCIILKMNGLEDKRMIKELYDAGCQGVKIDLIIRGICCLVTNQNGCKNITVTRIVDSYLEHARVFVFYNNGNNDTYISSSDFMNRNLHRRIEFAIPVYNETAKKELYDIMQLQLSDNVKACSINNRLQNVRILPENEKIVRSQHAIYEYIKEQMKKWEPQQKSE